MTIIDVLLGFPWLFNLDVAHYGHNNMYEFMFNGQKIHSEPCLPQAPRESHAKRKMVEHKEPITLLRVQLFLDIFYNTRTIYTLLMQKGNETQISKHLWKYKISPLISFLVSFSLTIEYNMPLT